MTKTHPNIGDYGLLILLAFAWGSAFTFIKVSVESISPILLSAVRVALGAGVLTIIAYMKGYSFPRSRAVWAKFLFLGVTGNAAPFFFIAWGEVRVDSGLAAIIAGTIPLMVMLLAHFMTRDEKWHANQALAVLFGFLGIVTLVGWEALAGFGQNLLGQSAVFIGVCSYAIYGVAMKSLPPMPTEIAISGILISASAVMVPLCFLLPGTLDFAWSADWVMSAVFLGLVSTAGGNMLFLTLLKRRGANFSALNNYLVPVIGVVIGVIFLGEAPRLSGLIALGFIMVGLLMPRLPGLVRRATD